MRTLTWQAAIVLTIWASVAAAQSPGVLYTWEGTGNVHQWLSSTNNSLNVATLNNDTPGMLTVVETGDPDPFGADDGGALVIRDHGDRRLESTTATGGLDLLGLEYVEMDVAHNGTGNVNVQFFVQATPSSTYIWAGSNGARGGPDFSLGPGNHTLQFPLGILTPAEQVYIRTIGLSVRNHFDQGNLTWTFSELRSTGTPMSTRDLATHDVGLSDSGLQGAFANFEIAAIVGNNGSQNQTGLSHNPSDTGSLQWTDRGGAGTTESPSGAAIGWGNGTTNASGTFFQRLTDLSNYTHVTYRVSATDPSMTGGLLGIQAYFQTGSFQPSALYQVAGETALSIDGQFHDLTFSLAGVTDRRNVQFSGLNLFAHENDLVINVDLVRYVTIEGLPGDYNGDGFVDAADYTVWRNNLGGDASALEPGSRDPMKMGPIDGDDYTFWKNNYGNGSGSGGLASTAAVPEPATWLLSLAVGISFGMRTRRVR